MLNHINMDVRRTGRGAILCLDLGRKCGWASVGEDMKITSGVFHFPGRSGRHPGDYCLRFQHMLISYRKGLINPLDPKKLVLGRILYEEIMFSGGHNKKGEETGQQQTAARLYGEWRGILKAFAATHNIPLDGIHNATIKKFIAGHGNAEKKDVIWAIRALGHEPEDDNEADALAMAYLQIAREQGVKEAA